MKSSKQYAIVAVLAALCLVGVALIPETGTLSLWNEVGTILLMGLVEVGMVKGLIALVKSRNVANALLVFVVAALIGTVAVSKTVKTAKDFSSGPRRVLLQNCDVEKRSTLRGIFSQSYRLEGRDANGKQYQLIISGEDYSRLKNKKQVAVICYPNTGRIVEFEKVSGRYE